MGSPLLNGVELKQEGVTENRKKNVSGYSILEAGDLDEALSLLNIHPHLALNSECTIEVHEVMPMPATI